LKKPSGSKMNRPPGILQMLHNRPFQRWFKPRRILPGLVLVLLAVLLAETGFFNNPFLRINRSWLRRADELRAIPELPAIGKEARILIFAPHPDDEVIGTAGLIQKARRAGARVRVVYLTNGDHDEIAFKIDAGRFALTPREYLAMGERRRRESAAAAEFLGLEKGDLIFLGYPDFGTMHIWEQHWGPAPAFSNDLTRASAVPYPDNFSYRAPYKGESIVADLLRILKEYRPTAIFVTMPADFNADHQAAWCFLSLAVLEAGFQTRPPDVFLFLVHLGGWPRPLHYHPNLPLLPPARLTGSELSWFKLPLTPEETGRKYRALRFFASVMKGRAYLWSAFARQNELFATLPEFRMRKVFPSAWEKALEVENLEAGDRKAVRKEEADLEGVSYLKVDDHLLVRMLLKRKLAIETGLSLYLFGYRRDVTFNSMPKIRLAASILKTVPVYDGSRKIGDLPVKLAGDGTELLLSVPLAMLGRPEAIFTSLHFRRADLSLDSTAWHLLRLQD